MPTPVIRTTDATWTRAGSGGAQFPPDCVARIAILVLASNHAGKAAGWVLEGYAQRVGNAAAVVIGGTTFTALLHTSTIDAVAWDVRVALATGLEVEVLGAVGDTVDWYVTNETLIVMEGSL